MLQRHAACSAANLRLKTTADVMTSFQPIVISPGFVRRLRDAKQDPDSADARALVLLIILLMDSAGSLREVYSLFA